MHVVHHVAVGDRARAAGIVAGHAAQRRLRRRADVYGKPQAARPEPRVELVEHDAGLDGNRPRRLVQRDDAIEVLAVVDHERRTDGLPALRAAGASRQHGNAQFAADGNRRLDVVVGGGDQHADGIDLVDGRIGGVSAARRPVEQDVARERRAAAGRPVRRARRSGESAQAAGWARSRGSRQCEGGEGVSQVRRVTALWCRGYHAIL